MEQCPICGKQAEYVFQQEILYKYQVSYFRCPHCGFLFTEKPYWLQESYASAINLTDTGYVARNQKMATIADLCIRLFGKKKGESVDYAGGYGMFVRLMRDRGYPFYWQDAYCENLFARGFEYASEKHYDLLTAFEVFEHLATPGEDIQRMLGLADIVLFSTVLIPKTGDLAGWGYLGTAHGQHISFYSRETLAYLARQNQRFFYTNGKNLHLFSRQALPLWKRDYLWGRTKWLDFSYRKAFQHAIADAQQLSRF